MLIKTIQQNTPPVSIKQEPCDQIPHAPMHTNVEYTMHPHYMEDKMKRCDSQQNTSFLSEKSSGYDFENLVQDESKRTPVHEDILSKGFKKNIEQADEKQPIKTKTRDHKSLHSRAQTVQLKTFKTKSRSITPSWQKSNVKERKFGNDLKKYNANGEKRDIDARYEPVPNSHFSKHGLKDRADYLTLDDGDGKTTFYHYKEVERQQKRSTEDDRAPRKKKISTKGVNKTDQPMINSTAEEIHGKLGQQTSIVDNKEEILREALKKRLANKIPNEENLIRNEKETPNKKENISDNSKEIKQNEEKISLLDKVNRIIKSCVMLKEERKTNENITNNETKKIEHNEENKVLMVADLESGYDEAIINPSETLSKVKDYKLEEGELKDSDQDDESELIGLQTIQRTVTIIKKKTKNLKNQKKNLSVNANPIRSSSNSSCTTNHSSYKTRSQTRDRTRTRSRSLSRSRSFFRGRQGRMSLSYSRRRRSITRSRSWSRPKSYRYRRSRSRSSPRYTEYRRRPSRSPDRMRRKEQWVAVSPCSIQENVTLEKCSTMMVTVAPRGQFSFKDNIGSMVRMTKWTGRDYIGCIHIKPQIVTIDENLDLQIEVENPYPEKKLYLRKYDNISCLSILTSPIPSALFSSINSSTTDKYEDGNKRWFKVTSVVLHKKGMQFIHLGYHGCYHHCFYHYALLLHS